MILNLGCSDFHFLKKVVNKMSRTNCPNCGAPFSNFALCSYCGTPIDSEVYYSGHNEVIYADDRPIAMFMDSEPINQSLVTKWNGLLCDRNHDLRHDYT